MGRKPAKKKSMIEGLEDVGICKIRKEGGYFVLRFGSKHDTLNLRDDQLKDLANELLLLADTE